MNTPQAKTGVEVERLPELPEPESYRRDWDGDVSDLGNYVHADRKDELDELPWESLYTADQMRSYATAALAAERAKNLEVARLIMANDRTEAVKWATGLAGSLEDGVRIDESAIAAERAEAVRIRGVLSRLIGTPEDPNNGWRGNAKTSDEHFACEYCGAEHLDCTLIEHKWNCPIPSARSTLTNQGDTK